MGVRCNVKEKIYNLKSEKKGCWLGFQPEAEHLQAQFVRQQRFGFSTQKLVMHC
jgi:hypothetical protein